MNKAAKPAKNRLAKPDRLAYLAKKGQLSSQEQASTTGYEQVSLFSYGQATKTGYEQVSVACYEQASQTQAEKIRHKPEKNRYKVELNMDKLKSNQLVLATDNSLETFGNKFYIEIHGTWPNIHKYSIGSYKSKCVLNLRNLSL